MTETKSHSLHRYTSDLTHGDAVPIPEAGETWRAMLRRLSVPQRIAEVTEETYWHYLEVLPPQWMEGNTFCFAEGTEPFRLFWQAGNRHFCRRLTWNETHRFCDLAGIRRDYYLY